MAIKYGFFNSVNGDRLYNAEDIGNYFVKLISDGVFQSPENNLQVTASTDMTVSVAPGWGFIACHWLNSDTYRSLTLNGSNPSLNRIDRIVLRLDRANRCMEIGILTGTPAGIPTAPALTRTSNGIYELSLAQIYVAAGATAITENDITDERGNGSVCGYVTSLLGNGENYSYDEAAVGKWVDGSTIYRKTVYVPNFPTTNESHYYFYPEAGYHFTNLIKVDIMTTYVDGTYNYQWAGYCGNDRKLIETDLDKNTSIIAVNFFNPNPIADAYLTFYYTKEADS